MSDPLDRRTGETTKANRALRDYAAMGPGRSLRLLSQQYQNIPETELPPPSLSFPTLKLWSAKHKWTDRVAEWDAEQNQLLDEQNTEMWLARMAKLREQEWEHSQALIERAQEMLNYPLAQVRKVEEEDGKTLVTIVMPAKWSLRDAAAYAETASRLARLATGMETDRTQTRHADAEGNMLVLGGNIDPDDF